MGGVAGGAAGGPDGPLAAEAATPAGTGEPCPECATSRTGRFCEVCGHDFLAAELDPTGTGGRTTGGGGEVASPPQVRAEPKPNTAAELVGAAPGGRSSAAELVGAAPGKRSSATGWRVVVTADRSYYDRMRAAADADAEEVAFPAYCPERRFALVPPQVLIGRLSRSRGIEPDIDLTGPPADPAVSHSHAILVVQPDGGWAVVDLGSANGTYVNDSATAIEPNLPVPVADGDRVHVGAWSTLTLRAG
jgi:hypothetical protein